MALGSLFGIPSPYSSDDNRNLALAASIGLLSGQTGTQQAANAGQAVLPLMMQQQQQQKALAEQNKTLQYLEQTNPQLAAQVRAGLPIAQAWQQQLEAQKPKKAEFKTLPDGTYGTWDGTQFQKLGTAENVPAGVQEQKYWMTHPDEWTAYQQRQLGKNNDVEQRKAAAHQAGLDESDPAYQSYLLTGKMPREDQQNLTAVDKKAILDADEMVNVNTSAIDSLKKAKELSTKANAGYFSGTRATLAANLPDLLVPDQISSPQSAEATQNFDNAIVGQALTQLKAIFGGAPTEGERAILLQLQGSSNLQPAVREAVIDRAIAAAERRLAFNKERADSLRGGTFYKAAPAAQTQGVNTTTSGTQWRVVPDANP